MKNPIAQTAYDLAIAMARLQTQMRGPHASANPHAPSPGTSADVYVGCPRCGAERYLMPLDTLPAICSTCDEEMGEL